MGKRTAAVTWFWNSSRLFGISWTTLFKNWVPLLTDQKKSSLVLTTKTRTLFGLCEHCEYKPNWKQNLIKSIHEGKKVFENVNKPPAPKKSIFSCELCNYTITSKSSLQQHVKSVHEKVSYDCDHCDYMSTLKELC